MCSMMGMPKAIVFPDPVAALPTTSCPSMILGMAACWIAVGFENPDLDNEDKISGESWKDLHADTSTSRSLISRNVSNALES